MGGFAGVLAAVLVVVGVLAGCAADGFVGSRPELVALGGEYGGRPSDGHPAGYVHRLSGSLAGYRVVAFSDLPQWNGQDFTAALSAFRNGCVRLAERAAWRAVCAEAATVSGGAERHFFERHFTPWEVSDNGRLAGMVTGYYEPVLRGSLYPTAWARFPVYGVPSDLVSVSLEGRRSGVVRVDLTDNGGGWIVPSGAYVADLSMFRIGAADRAVQARVEGARLLPYFTRAQINGGALVGRVPVLAYAEDPVDLFFMHIQGSGRIATPEGRYIRLGFAGKNGHSYVSIGRYMVQQGYLPLHQTGMQEIRDWLGRHPERLAEVLEQNPSYVFFRELPDNGSGPVGALGVPLTAGYSAAVDGRFITMGAPIFLATVHPANGTALNRLMAAQDTGTAIKGAVRVDFFWGYGHEAGQAAGRMRHTGYVWQLLPHGMLPGSR